MKLDALVRDCDVFCVIYSQIGPGRPGLEDVRDSYIDIVNFLLFFKGGVTKISEEIVTRVVGYRVLPCRLLKCLKIFPVIS